MISVDYKVLGRLDKGSYGKVYTVQRRSDLKIFAMKKIKSTKLSNEVAIMDHLDHENILKIIDSSESIRKNWDGLRYRAKLIFEHFPMNLHHYLYNKLIYSINKFHGIKLIMRQILNGVEYLHKMNIAHCDLKLRNILISDCFCLKICDFGMAQKLRDNEKYSTCVQTLNYAAPEILIGYPYYDKSIDLWSVGCIFGELFKTDKLLNGESDDDQVRLITNACGSFSQSFMEQMRSKCSRLKFKNEPKIRILRQYLGFFVEDEAVIDLIDSFLRMDPVKRISTTKALCSKYFEPVEHCFM